MDDATFPFSDPFRGEDARLAVRYMVRALSTTTVGDMMYIGQVYRSRIRQRTLAGIDVNGASFTPYSTKGPYYFYPNRESGAARGPSRDGSHQEGPRDRRQGTPCRHRARRNAHAIRHPL